MSAIAGLPDELLSYIQSLASGSLVDFKYNMAQVSRRWRRVALGSPLLWKHFCLYSRIDCKRVHRVLELSGPSALLDVDIAGPAHTEADAADYVEPAMRALVPHAARIRSIDTFLTSAALLNGSLEFPVLRTLRVRASQEDRRAKISIDARNLHVLELVRVIPACLTGLLSKSLDTIYIDRCHTIDYADLLVVLLLCPNVRRLTFRTVAAYMAEGLIYRAIDAHWDIPPMRTLENLDLALPSDEFRHVLDNIVARETVLEVVTAFIAPFDIGAMLPEFCVALLRGVSPIRQLVVEDRESVTLRDDDGRVRIITSQDSQPLNERFWSHLALEYAVPGSVREITIAFSLWANVAVDFSHHPPTACSYLRVLLDESNIRNLCRWFPPVDGAHWHAPLFLPKLAHLELAVAAGYHPVLACEAHIFLPLSRNVQCDAGRLIEVATEHRLVDPRDMRAVLDVNLSHRFTHVEP